MPDYLPPPARSETLAELLARCGGTQSVLDAHGAALARLPGGRVYGDGAVIAPDGQSVVSDLTVNFGSTPGGHWLQTYGYIRPPKPVPGVTALVATNLGFRYAHWLLEELPRLLTLPPDAADTVIAHARAPFIREAWELGRFAPRLIPASRHGHYACEHLLIPLTSAAGAPMTLREVRLVEAFVEPLRATGNLPTHDRIYLTRGKATRRRVTNEAELRALLESVGFKTIALETLPWCEQIRLFSHALEVVAPHGAGLANLIFCRPGTRVVELFNPAYHNPCYEHLVRLKHLDYHALGAAARVDRGKPPDPRAGRLDIVADLDQVRAALV